MPRPMKPARRTTWLATVADTALHTRHYLGAALVLLALAVAYLIAHAHTVKVGPVEVTRTR